MSFCAYCGKQLADGEACNCEGAVEARKSAVTTAEKMSQKVNEAINSETAAKVQGILGELKDLTISFFKKPDQTLRLAYESPRKGAQYAAGGIYAAVLFVFMWILLKVFNDAWKYAFGVTAVWCLMKLILMSSVFVLKKDEKKFADVCGIFCVSTIPQTTAYLAFFLLAKIGFPAGAVAMLVIWIAVDILYSVETMKVILSAAPEKAVRLYLIVEAVMVLVIYFIFSQIVQSMLQSMMSSFMGGLSGLNSLFN